MISEKKIINNDQISEHTQNLLGKKDNGELNRIPNAKLILDFKDKQKYSVYTKNLIYYVRKGFKVEILRGIRFFQSDFLKWYIDFNTNKRSKSKNEFEKTFFKLMNNSIHGKTMENVRLRIDLHLVKTFDQAKRYIRKPNFDYLKRFDENLCAIHIKKDTSLFE